MRIPRLFPRPIFALALGLFSLAASHASAQTVITSVPYTITTSGQYKLGGNLNSAVNGPAIKINAPNVVLDLNGYYVAGPGDSTADPAADNSVILIGNVANITIKNGTVAGNVIGIGFLGTTPANLRNYVVDTVVVTRCYLYGIYCLNSAPGSVVKNCSFSVIGNSTAGGNSSPIAIGTLGGGFRVEKNNINAVTATGSGASYGVYGTNSNFVISNTIANCDVGVSSGKCLNNLTYNVALPFQTTTNASGNN